MGRGFVKLVDPVDRSEWFLEWSTVVDAPITFGMRRDELEDYVRKEYGEYGLTRLPRWLSWLDKTGTSYQGVSSCEAVLETNYAGPDEEEATADDIVRWYCREWWRCRCNCGNAGYRETCWGCGQLKPPSDGGVGEEHATKL